MAARPRPTGPAAGIPRRVTSQGPVMTPDHPANVRPPLEPGLPVALALASLTAAGVCVIAPIEDRLVLSGLFLVIAAASAVGAVFTWVGGQRAGAPHG